MDYQKSPISLIFGTLSLEGCGGHPMRPKFKLHISFCHSQIKKKTHISLGHRVEYD